MAREGAPRPPCVVLDTNQWISSSLLRIPQGSAILFSLRRRRGTLGLPEVVEREVIKRLPRRLIRERNTAQTNLRALGAVLGVHFPLPEVDPADLERRVADRFRALEGRLERVPMSLSHAKSALDRVLSDQPPNTEKVEQFRDSLIWEAVLSLLRRYHVHFVTSDRTFYEWQEPGRGLASALRAEVDARRGTLDVHTELSALLRALGEPRDLLDKNEIVQAIEDVIRGEIREAAAHRGFTLQERVGYEVSGQLTEQDYVIAVTFSVRYALLHDQADVLAPQLTVYGTCSYDAETKLISDQRLEELDYEWRSANGDQRKVTDFFRYAASAVTLSDGTRLAPPLRGLPSALRPYSFRIDI